MLRYPDENSGELGQPNVKPLMEGEKMFIPKGCTLILTFLNDKGAVVSIGQMVYEVDPKEVQTMDMTEVMRHGMERWFKGGPEPEKPSGS